MHRATVRSFLTADVYPERTPAYRRSSPATEFNDHLQERWRQGCANTKQLYREIKQKGYAGCYNTLIRYLQKWRLDLPTEQRKQLFRQVFRTPSPREIKWWLLGNRSCLSEDNEKFLERLLEE